MNELKTYAGDEISKLVKKTSVQHSCGRRLVQIDYPETFDVTSLQDVPEHLKGKSFQDLPVKYHRYIQVRTITVWYDPGRDVSFCPQCGLSLEEKDIQPINTSSE